MSGIRLLRSVTVSRSAISAFESPSAISARTAASRGVVLDSRADRHFSPLGRFED
jgi:hypothetical protein